MNAAIEVTRAGDGFDVRLREGVSETRHRVTLAEADRARLAPGATAEATIAAAFRFLLDREPKESILDRFDLCLISRYFPEFENKLPEYVARG